MIEAAICFAVVFAAEALTAWLYFEYLFSRKGKNQRLALSFAVGYIFLFAVSRLGNTSVNALAFSIINYVLLTQNYQCNRRTALLQIAFLCFAMVGSEIFVALLIGLFGYHFSAYTYDNHVMLALAILSKLLYLMFSVIGSRVFAPHKHANEEPQLMALFCCLPLLSAAIAIFIVYYGMNVGIAGAIGIMTIMIVVTLLIVNLILFVLYNYLQKANKEYLALQLSIQQEQADTAYYKALQEQFENQRILIHDIRKHLSTIDGLAKQNGDREVEKYVSSLNETFAPASQAKLCSEPILNLVLIRFRDECKVQHVEFHCDVRESISSFMDISSITTLYGNLLSNALEAASSSAEKRIELSATRNTLQSVIVISVVNSCDIAPAPDGHGGFHTRKADKALHGVGLHSIHRIVKKYGGVSTMYFDSQTKQFHHIIQFPIPSEKVNIIK